MGFVVCLIVIRVFTFSFVRRKLYVAPFYLLVLMVVLNLRRQEVRAYIFVIFCGLDSCVALARLQRA